MKTTFQRIGINMDVKKNNIMKKYSLLIISSILIIGLAAVSCSKSLNNRSDEINQEKEYSVSIPAQKASTKVVADGGKASFSISEKVWVYNESTGKIDRNSLSPAENSATTTLRGELYGTYAVNDQLKLLYNSGRQSSVVNYTYQNGMIQNVTDAGVASVSIKEVEGKTIKTTEAAFTNLQSIFKLKFVDGSTTIKVKSVSITSVDNKLQQSYDVVNNSAVYGSVTAYNTASMAEVFIALRFTPNPSDLIIFNVIDENGKVYTGTKTAPASGFSIGKFYSSTISVTSHRFSISSSESVYFSPGNLNFEQSFIIPEYKYPITSPYESVDDCFIEGEVILSDDFINPENTTYVNGVTGWYLLSKQEWEYLLFERIIDGGSVSPYYLVTTDSNNGGTYGMLLPPEDANSEDVSTLSADGLNNINLSIFTAKGYVFLPAAGLFMQNQKLLTGEAGIYWTRTEESSDLYVMEYDDSMVDVDASLSTVFNYLTTRLVHK